VRVGSINNWNDQAILSKIRVRKRWDRILLREMPLTLSFLLQTLCASRNQTKTTIHSILFIIRNSMWEPVP
jgi:hypothetical protein